uniref:AlNc14C378G11201 protein n=1 Tax=Albugo laibachii Nc14 TaxID=890382 RepID=F0WYE1_9STRA|nr:AlNc14C378G11201 [Albugo laibachii Nc14]|eukprot:CCA26494.1 AlNc14C378G11201 [Albugo laibachii Nc14]
MLRNQNSIQGTQHFLFRIGKLSEAKRAGMSCSSSSYQPEALCDVVQTPTAYTIQRIMMCLSPLAMFNQVPTSAVSDSFPDYESANWYKTRRWRGKKNRHFNRRKLGNEETFLCVLCLQFKKAYVAYSTSRYAQIYDLFIFDGLICVIEIPNTCACHGLLIIMWSPQLSDSSIVLYVNSCDFVKACKRSMQCRIHTCRNKRVLCW